MQRGREACPPREVLGGVVRVGVGDWRRVGREQVGVDTLLLLLLLL